MEHSKVLGQVYTALHNTYKCWSHACQASPLSCQPLLETLSPHSTCKHGSGNWELTQIKHCCHIYWEAFEMVSAVASIKATHIKLLNATCSQPINTLFQWRRILAQECAAGQVVGPYQFKHFHTTIEVSTVNGNSPHQRWTRQLLRGSALLSCSSTLKLVSLPLASGAFLALGLHSPSTITILWWSHALSEGRA